MFHDFFNGCHGEGSFLQEFSPKLDLSEDLGEFLIIAEIPGVDEKDISLELVDNTLVISGEKRNTKEDRGKNYYYSECSYGQFRRTIGLPENSNKENLTAEVKNGNLVIKVPKKEQTVKQAKNIEIKSGSMKN